jgi:hypothetical protein
MSGWNFDSTTGTSTGPTNDESPSTSPKSTAGGISKGRFQVKYSDGDKLAEKQEKVEPKPAFDPFHGNDVSSEPVLVPTRQPIDAKPVVTTPTANVQPQLTQPPQTQQPQTTTPTSKVGTALNTQRPLSPTQSSVSTPSNTSPMVTGPKRQFKIKDVEDEDVPPARMPTSGDFSGALPRSTSNSNLNVPQSQVNIQTQQSQEPTISSLAKQVNELTISGQQTFKVLNMVYNMMLQQQKIHQNLTNPSTEVVEISQMVLRLQERVDTVLSDNIHLKQENESLKGEVQMLKKQIQAREEKQ